MPKRKHFTARFALRISSGGDAFQDNPGAQVASILRDLAHRLEEGCDIDGVYLHDVNGNTCGDVKTNVCTI